MTRFSLGAALLLCACAAFAQNGIDPVARALMDSSRPLEDRALDGARHPDALLAFAGVRPGDRVVDLMPGNGYFTRLFSTLVGPRGQVLALQPLEMDRAAPDGVRLLRLLVASAGHANVSILLQPVNAIHVTTPADLVWTSQNYHDLHAPFMGVRDVASVNRALFAMLKPGGTLIVVDHAAQDGSGARQADALHRIDPQTVRAELTAAGFVYAGASAVLRRPDDSHSEPAFAPAMKGRTDRFVYKFRKPMFSGERP